VGSSKKEVAEGGKLPLSKKKEAVFVKRRKKTKSKTGERETAANVSLLLVAV